LIGTGWRAFFYVRVAKALPERFCIVSVLTHTEERKRELVSMGLNGTTDLDDALSYTHDAVIVSSGPKGLVEMLQKLSGRGEAIISETQFLSLSDGELEEVSKLKGHVMEQWPETPLFKAVLSSIPLIGKPDQLCLSGLHNHHAAAIARKVFSPSSPFPKPISHDFRSAQIKTGSREGIVRSGEMEEYKRKVRVLEFPGKGLFINDFSSNQYHTELTPKRIEIRGERGYVDERGATFLSEGNIPLREEFVFSRDTGPSGSLTLSHVSRGSDIVFENPYCGTKMNDDEIAIASILDGIFSGSFKYSFGDAVQDVLLGRML